MGLDSVELVMAVEEDFQLTFEEDEISGIVTVDDFYQLILKSLDKSNKLDNSSETRCLTSHTFYQLRKTLINELGIPRSQLFPKQEMATLLPKQARRAQWDTLTKALCLPLPELSRPTWFSSLLTYGVLFWLIGSLLGRFFDFLTAWEAGISVGLALGFAWLAYWLSKPLAIYFAPEMTTLGETTKTVLYRNFSKIRSLADKKQWNEKEIWEVYKRIIVEQLGVKPENVVKSACFVEDLGMD
jgi:acyl carrier protein